MLERWRIGNEPGAVASPGRDNPPVHLHSFEILGLRNGLGFAGVDQLNVNPLQVGVSQVLAVGLNGAARHRVLTGIGGELPLF